MPARSALVTAVALEVRGMGSKSDSSPNISPGPCTLSRFSRPSGAAFVSLILPDRMMYSFSPESPSANSRSPRSRCTLMMPARSALASSSVSDSNSGVSRSTSSTCVMTPPRPAARATWDETSWWSSLARWVACGQPLLARDDLGLGDIDAHPGRRLDHLAGLQSLVHLEEVLDF